MRSVGLRSWHPAVMRIAADPHVILAVAVVFAALVIEVIAGADVLGLAGPAAVYLTVQIVLALRGPAGRSALLDTARLLVALSVVFWMTLRTNDLAAMPLSCLYLLIVSLAAFGGAFLWQVSPEANLLAAFGFGVLGTVWFAVWGRGVGE